MNLYANAHDVLPAPLLREVQKHWQGTLYVPPPLCSSSNAMVLKLIRSGLPANDVAGQCGITIRRVYQIAQNMGDENPYAQKSARLPRVAASPEVE
jgi:hypothetical protein